MTTTAGQPFYTVTLLALFGCNVIALSLQRVWRAKRNTPEQKVALAEAQNEINLETAKSFAKNFFLAMALAYIGDWMQGPYIYVVYRYDKLLQARTISILYIVGFASAGVAGTFIGKLADNCGRKTVCLLYCFIYALGCLSMLSQNLWVLVMGRVFGGFSTTILSSVFETWMIADYKARGLEGSAITLGMMFSGSTFLSAAVAVGSGVVGEMTVKVTGSQTTPFLVCVVFLLAAAVFIGLRWEENYGHGKDNGNASECSSSSYMSFVQDKRLLNLAITSCAFEGTTYLFVFLWTPTLRRLDNCPTPCELPFGLIFSSFMCAMMLGSTLVNTLIVPVGAGNLSVVLRGILGLSSISCFLAAVLKSQKHLFLAFCFLEVCVGAYYPSIASMKARAIKEDQRGHLYAALKVPLNIFVVIGHILAKDDESQHLIFLGCGVLLLLCSTMTRL